MKTMIFWSFEKRATGRVVTGNGHEALVYSRNPYGTHNLVVVDLESREAFRHGNNASLDYAWAWIGRKAWVKAMLFLMACGVFFEDYVEESEPVRDPDPEGLLVKYKKEA